MRVNDGATTARQKLLDTMLLRTMFIAISNCVSDDRFSRNENFNTDARYMKQSLANVFCFIYLNSFTLEVGVDFFETLKSENVRATKGLSDYSEANNEA
jgi:hypothetical protein